MSLSENLKIEVGKIFADVWAKREGQKVPETDEIKLSGNEGVTLEGVVLYADLSESTFLVDNKSPEFAGEIYKTYLHCAAKIIRDQGGTITAYDGDRIMAVYIGDSKNTSAAKTALKINYAVNEIINPSLKKQYPSATYIVKQVVGIDSSSLLVARTGVRGSNDLVWVGRAANHAAKLSSRTGCSSYISYDVYKHLDNEAKYTNGVDMWSYVGSDNLGRSIYGSSWQWKP